MIEISNAAESLWLEAGVYPDDLSSLAEIAADDAWGALKQGWDRYDLGRGGRCPHTHGDVAHAVHVVIERGPAALAGGDRVDAIRDAALGDLGYTFKVIACETIVTGRA